MLQSVKYSQTIQAANEKTFFFFLLKVILISSPNIILPQIGSLVQNLKY